jgi:hypothetical protein
VKYESCQAQPGKVEHEWGATALPKNYKQADAQIDDPDEIDIQIAGGQIVNRAEVIRSA